MRILVLGSTGMLGHKMVQRLRKNFDSVIGVSRPSFDAMDPFSVEKVLDFFRPHVVVNCVGLIKQRDQDPELSYAINAALPHALQSMCEERGAYLIHFSTDCVFSGNRGRYSEEDIPDPVDVYGTTKAQGEVVGENSLTLRTSIFGREIRNNHGILEWFLHQKGAVPGYDGAIFSGVSTMWLSDTVADLLKRKDKLTGLYQVSGEAVSKYQLLKIFNEQYGLGDTEVYIRSVAHCDRSLRGDKFLSATGIKTPTMEELVYWQRKADNEEGGYATIR